MDNFKDFRESLNKVITSTMQESSSLRLLFETRNITNHYSASFIKDSILRATDLVSGMAKLSQFDLDSIFILMRSLLELNVDLYWFYSILTENAANGEDLAKRFYQMGATLYLDISQKYEDIFKSDVFLKNVIEELDPKRDRELASKRTIIDLVDSSASKKLQHIQKIDWRALPGLINNKGQIEFRSRALIAIEMAQKISNLKHAPYLENWKILNAFTHWSASRMKYLETNVAEAFYIRHLNVSLGFVHDIINVGYSYLKIDAPLSIQLLRKEFYYYST